MKIPLRAGFVYFVIVFMIGFVLGAIRVLVVIPRTGELFAVLIELPLMLSISWFMCKYLIVYFQVPTAIVDRAIMGASGFAFLFVAEVALSTCAFGNSIESTFLNYRTIHGFVGLCGQLTFAVFPMLHLLKR
jgi:uncharacterized membrane protein YcgQ (UPF0703/DUF1980 family)